MENKRTREENGFRNTIQKDGRLNTTWSAAISSRITNYCRAINRNRTKFLEELVAKELDRLERERLEQMTREELMDEIQRLRK